MRFHSTALAKHLFFSDHFWRTSPCQNDHDLNLIQYFLMNKHRNIGFLTIVHVEMLERKRKKIREAYLSSVFQFLPQTISNYYFSLAFSSGYCKSWRRKVLSVQTELKIIFIHNSCRIFIGKLLVIGFLFSEMGQILSCYDQCNCT